MLKKQTKKFHHLNIFLYNTGKLIKIKEKKW